jgi:hypothetical protein
MPPLPGQTHSWGLNPKPGQRVETIVGGDELGQCPFGYLHFIDVRNEARPREISGFRTPLNMHANCPKDRLGNRMGTHDVERYIRGGVVHSAWEEGGFWGIDFSDIHYPKAVAWYVPPARSQSGDRAMPMTFVMEDGVISAARQTRRRRALGAQIQPRIQGHGQMECRRVGRSSPRPI